MTQPSNKATIRNGDLFTIIFAHGSIQPRWELTGTQFGNEAEAREYAKNSYLKYDWEVLKVKYSAKEVNKRNNEGSIYGLKEQPEQDRAWTTGTSERRLTITRSVH